MIVTVSWVSVAVFTVVAVLDALGVDAFSAAATAVSLALFFASLPLWMYALGLAFVRSARGEDVALPTLFLLAGPVAHNVRWHLFGAFGVSVVVAAATGAANPFGWLVPMFTLGLVGLWGARHGTYPPRRPVPSARGPGGRDGSKRPTPREVRR
jgi:hypothetical protein